MYAGRSLKYPARFAKLKAALVLVPLTAAIFYAYSSCESWEEHSYCSRCGALHRQAAQSWFGHERRRDLPVPHLLYERHFRRDGPAHRWVEPPYLDGPGRERQKRGWSAAQRLHDQTVMRKVLALRQFSTDEQNTYGSETALKTLNAVLAQGPARARAIWQRFLAPERHLQLSTLALFRLQICNECKWALWTLLDDNYRCDADQEVRCRLLAPAPFELYANDGYGDFRAVSFDWRDWNPGLSPPPQLFGVGSFASTDEAENQRARALIAQALNHLGVGAERPPSSAKYDTVERSAEAEVRRRPRPLAHLPIQVELRARSFSEPPTDRYARERVGEVERCRYLVALDLGLRRRCQQDDRDVLYAVGKGLTIKPQGRRSGAAESETTTVPVTAFANYDYARQLRAFTPAVALYAALADTSQLRFLGHDEIDGRPVDRVLITLAPNEPAEYFFSSEDGALVATRDWRHSYAGMDLVTTIFRRWQSVAGIKVPFEYVQTRLGRPLVEGRVEQFEFNPRLNATDFAFTAP